jgi:hypothetical protein
MAVINHTMKSNIQRIHINGFSNKETGADLVTEKGAAIVSLSVFP